MRMEATPPPLPLKGRTSSLAVWSLVLGCLGLVLLVICVGPLFAVAAVICGHLAHSRIKKSAGILSGDGLAVAGLVTGYTSIGLSLILIPIFVSIALPNFVKARKSAQVNVCVNNLRKIDIAKQTCAMEKKLTSEQIPSPEDLKPYLGQDLSTLTCPQGGHYTINAIADPPTCSFPGHVLNRDVGR
jgi:hypothetical protein